MGKILTFNSKADAFDYMFTTLCEQGEDMMEAAKKAEQFADIVARNRSLPDAPKGTIAKCMDMLKQVSEVKREYPEVWDIVTNLASGIFGAVVGTAVTRKEDEEEPMAEPINIDELE